MEHVRREQGVAHLAADAARIFSEEEVQLECEGKYDFEKIEQYIDDEFYLDLPHRRITNWSLLVPTKHNPLSDADQSQRGNLSSDMLSFQNCSFLSESRCVGLPESDEFLPPMENTNGQKPESREHDYYQHAVLVGWLLPSPNFPEEPKLKVAISGLQYVALDPTRELRGFWVASCDTPHAACYWLQEPSPGQEPFMMKRRGQLGVLSNLLDSVRDFDDWATRDPVTLHNELGAKLGSEPFSLELLRAFALPIKHHLQQLCKHSFNSQTKFFRHLGRFSKTVSENQLARLCLQAESRSKQHPWGGPLSPSRTGSTLQNNGLLQQSIQRDCKPSIARKRQVDEEPDWDLITRESKLLRKTVQYAASRQPRNRRLNPLF